MEVVIIILVSLVFILLILCILAGFSLRNLFRNVEIYKKENEAYKEEIKKSLIIFNNIEEKIVWSQTLLTEIDKRGTFASDDEIGWFFKNIQLIQDELNGFRFKKQEVEEKTL